MRQYDHLSYQERSKIYNFRCQKKSVRKIAKEIGRAHTTVWRELTRNSDRIGYLWPVDAHRKAQNCKKKLRLKKIERIPQLKSYVVEKLNLKWAPKAIAGRWNMKHKKPEHITAESIYSYCYSDTGIALGLHKLLPRAKPKRGMRWKQRSNKIGIPNRISISKRPECVNNRSQIGDLEGDLFFNSESQAENTLSVIDRTTRYVSLVKNGSKRTDEVIGNLISVIKRDYNGAARTITFDNGKEFAMHGKIKEALGVETYFCHPGSPWEKGSAERLNGMARRYFPFKVPSSMVTQEGLDAVAASLNHIPREILNFLTPCEAQRKALQVESLKCCTFNLT